MASLQIDPSGNYHVKFRFAGKQYRRSLHTKMRRTAEASACHIEENMRLVEGGRLELPEDADVPTFLLSDGKLLGKPLPHRESLSVRFSTNIKSPYLPMRWKPHL